MNMLRANSACQAPVVTSRTRTRCAGIGAGIQVLREQVLALQVGLHAALAAW